MFCDLPATGWGVIFSDLTFGEHSIFKGTHLSSQLSLLSRIIKTLRNVKLLFQIFFIECNISFCFLALLMNLGYHLIPIRLASQLFQKADYM